MPGRPNSVPPVAASRVRSAGLGASVLAGRPRLRAGARRGPAARSGRRSLACWLALLAALLVPAAARAGQPSSFTLEVSPQRGTLSDTYIATVKIEIPGIRGPDRYWDPDFRDFRVVDSQTKLATSSRIDPQRGQRLTTIEIRRYVLAPSRAGRLLVGPAKVRIGSDEYETRSARVVVRGAGDATPGNLDDDDDPTAGAGGGVPGFRPPDPSAHAGEDMFLHAVTDKDQVYVGEQVTVTWLLYTRAEVLKFEPRPPRLDDFWSETLHEPDAYFTYHDDRVGRIPYVAAVVSKRALFPTKAGTLRIPPFEARVATLSTAVGSGETLRSKPLRLEVVPLPDGAPPGFDPTYVGQFTAEASVDRSRIDAADALTLTLSVRGTGAIRRTEPPVLEVPGFEFRAPRDFDQDVDLSSNEVKGERTYRYWTTPTEGGKQVIAAIEIPYFDPSTGRYEAARTRPMTVFVEGDPNAVQAIETGSNRENVISRDIRLIRSGDQIGSRVALRLHDSSWFWILALAPPLLFALIVITDRVREGLKKETPRARLRRARGRARQRFRVAEIHLRGNRPPKFFAELAHVISEHIAERVGQPVRSMTRAEMRAFLAEKGFDDTTIKQIVDSLESFDFARFAPSAAGAEEMRAALRRTRELLRRIERTRLSGQDEEESA